MRPFVHPPPISNLLSFVCPLPNFAHYFMLSQWYFCFVKRRRNTILPRFEGAPEKLVNNKSYGVMLNEGRAPGGSIRSRAWVWRQVADDAVRQWQIWTVITELQVPATILKSKILISHPPTDAGCGGGKIDLIPCHFHD